jgi:hypothetical protein
MPTDRFDNRAVELRVDGQTAASNLDFSSSFSWSSWRNTTTEITLNTGHHRIRLQATTPKVCLDSGKLPVRIPLYIAIVALARYVILEMKAMDNWRMLAAAGAALVLAFTVLVIRYGHAHSPYGKDE